MGSSSEATVLVWARLALAHRAVLGAIERALRSAGLPSLEWYDVLWELEKGGDLRPRDLQNRLLLAQYNLSRLLDRMVGDGLVARLPCPEDRRGHLIALTEAGARVRKTMWPVYCEAMATAIGDHLGDGDAAKLASLLEPLYARSQDRQPR